MEGFRFENFYDSEEKVIFKGQPSMATYPITEAFFFGMILIIIMLSDGFMLGASVFKSFSGESMLFEIILFTVALFFHMIPIVIWGITLVKKFYSTNKVYYLITDKRAVKIINDDKVSLELIELVNVTDIRIVNSSLVFVVNNNKTVFKYIPEPQRILDDIVAAFSAVEEPVVEEPVQVEEEHQPLE